MSAPTLTIYRGLPGSGKSTAAQEYIKARVLSGTVDYGIVRVERDAIRRELSPTGTDWYTQPFEGVVTDVQTERIKNNLKAGNDVIVSDTNLPNANAKRLAKVGVWEDAHVQFVDFRGVPLEDCLANNRLREGTDKFVDEQFIINMHERFIKGKKLTNPEIPELEQLHANQLKAEKYEPSPYGVPTVLLDLDGTAALHMGRDPYDTTRYHEDHVSGNVLDIVLGLNHLGYQIDVMTGRDASHRDVCLQWLDTHSIPYTNLHMRPEGNRERDDKVKLDLFEQHYRNNRDQSVQFCIDDRDRVVSMYRNVLGIQVFQAAEGNF